MTTFAWLEEQIARIALPDLAAGEAARARLDRLTKPQGSLGQLEPLLVRLAAATGQVCPALGRRAVLLAAADHGVADEGVSAYPQTVTGQMVLNFLRGGAAINALAKVAGAQIVVVDAGVKSELPAHAQLRQLQIRAGSGNIAREAAMTANEGLALLKAGVDSVDTLWKSGLDLLALGEMGIANTTPAAALTSVYTGATPAQSVGRGTGIDDQTLLRKREVVARALARAKTNSAKALPSGFLFLTELGGLEIAFLAGAILGAAARRVPVLLDGYITSSAALAAVAMAPAAQPYLFASHCSAEPGHRLALAQLSLVAEQGAGPLLQLDLRLGEGSGAALAMPLLASATELMRDMATFEQAGVSEE
jgi:nicotinate-nucleotide--dimethylbenzimidazole phosphoribosyltransferase